MIQPLFASKQKDVYNFFLVAYFVESFVFPSFC